VLADVPSASFLFLVISITSSSTTPITSLSILAILYYLNKKVKQSNKNYEEFHQFL